MTDVEEIIEYIKSLKKGFDKELFQSKVDELASVVDNEGLDYRNFHTLFKVWLNLSIPITKWVSLGVCLVPKERIIDQTIEYSLRWLMANFENQANSSRVGFVLDWVTAAMDTDCIDMNSLDSGYEIFYTMISYEDLTAHCIKLVYTLTKPVDVTRRRVLELLSYAKKREGKKNKYRQIQVLLGLFKSYKPECVPEDVPSISIHTSFRKLNIDLLNRFRSCQSNQNSAGLEQERLIWINPTISEAGRNKKADPLVPNMEFLNVGSKQYADDAQQMTYLDFTDTASLVQGAACQRLARPARLRALLRSAAAAPLLAAAHATAAHAFLAHDLHHLLTNCFLDISPHSYMEKQDLLCRLAILQRTLMQGIPVVTRFLAQYLPFWNERDFVVEILELVEWVAIDNSEHVISILDSLSKVYCRSQPIEQCALMKAVTNMYSNLVYSSTRSLLYFMSMKPSESDYSQILTTVVAKISEMCEKGLQISPEDMRVSYSAAVATARCAGRAPPAALLLTSAVLSPSAAMLDKAAALILRYKEAFAIIKQKNGMDTQSHEQKKILKAYTFDIINCFYEQCLTGRHKGLIFRELHPQLVGKLCHIVPDADAKLSIRNHLALAPYTYMQLQAIDHSEANNKMLFDTVIEQEFPHLREFVTQAMSDWR
ncbi:uncharacterized protein [Epargyreus clarus]|uniref:uncharacterized protein n=1 Tax=Epargyreus clarus TaxID=520877 RepID=UPI003C2F7A1A